ncbi:MAG: alpha/beta fold hydrolase [Rhodoferax sp.]|nr:alpha/beta fold hydrolase [Rhodoferax sp.]
MKIAIAAAGLLVVATAGIGGAFQRDMADARLRAAAGSAVVDTGCGPIEYQQAGQGVPLLMIHGSGGGHDQGMDWARPLSRHGVRVIAMSRFGYLRTPRPADASPQAQADAHVCLLDALGIKTAAVIGVSAGAPSAMQAAIRHPDRVRALVLVVPIAWKPGSVADSAPPCPTARMPCCCACSARTCCSGLRCIWRATRCCSTCWRHHRPSSRRPPRWNRPACRRWPNTSFQSRCALPGCATIRGWAKAWAATRWSRYGRQRW